jgi:hypothetical protein
MILFYSFLKNQINTHDRAKGFKGLILNIPIIYGYIGTLEEDDIAF